MAENDRTNEEQPQWKRANRLTDVTIPVARVLSGSYYASGSSPLIIGPLHRYEMLHQLISTQDFHSDSSSDSTYSASVSSSLWLAGIPQLHRPISGASEYISVFAREGTTIEAWVALVEDPSLGAPFEPSDISDLVLDLDAAFGIDEQGTGVHSWTSRVGDHVAIQSVDGNRPTFTAANASFNNHPSVDFDNANPDSMAVSQSSDFDHAAGMDLIVVLTDGGAGGGTDTLINYSDTGVGGWRLEGQLSTTDFNVFTMLDNVPATIAVIGSGSQSTPHIYRANFDGDSTIGASTDNVGGTNAITTPANNIDQPLELATTQGSNKSNPEFIRILLYSRKLTDEEWSYLYNHLSQKYGGF